VYGLAARPDSDLAVSRLFEAKGRRPGQPTPILINAPGELDLIAANVPPAARSLMVAFWPGQVTIILPKAENFRSLAVPGPTVGVRVADHEIPRLLIERIRSPITGTSANIAGGPEPLTAADVLRDLRAKVDVVIDGGRCPGVPSTVVDCSVEPPRVLREGAVSTQELSRASGIQFR
jgi:L-threonylcarbamoyladenylate synthase